MHQTIALLMEEHRLIEEVLGSLETLTIAVDRGLTLERGPVADLARFFGGFADAAHHGKEEDILFRRMVEAGFPREGGPIGVMLFEHTQGREHVGGLRRLGSAEGAVTPEERQAFLAHGSAYVPLLRQHILKEDNILYPMALQHLGGPGLAAMAEEFDAFERKLADDGSKDGFRRLAGSIVAAFPPDRARMAAASAGSGCFARR